MGRLERYWEAVANIRAVGVSTGGWITVTRDPAGEIDVWIRTGMLRRCPPEQVAEEVRTCLLAAVADHRRQYRQLRIEYFGSPLGAEAPGSVDEPAERR
ncbi:hypothetical protein WEI85_21075 [Actinomycetes bacterium KLBMP 9797]